MRRRILFLSVLAFVGIFFLASGQAFAADSVPLNREDTVALVKPSVVRIAQHVKGSATIPAFKIDLKDWSVSVDPSRTPQIIPIDETLSGSGFVVSSDGYIVTNSHVVSLQTTKIDVIANAVMPAMYESAFALNQDEADAFFRDNEAAFQFSKRVFEYASGQSVFSVAQTLVVLDPASQKEKFEDLIEEGFPARVVSVNDRFYDDDKDVALIRIDQENLPTVSLGDSGGLNVGKQISIFGFPATAEFNARNPLESTFTQGVISALKDSENKDFKVFQTDAKVSEGSSGGPLVGDDGRVSGIITFQTDPLGKGSGDSFAFALPVEMIRSMLDESGVSVKTSPYGEYLRQGFASFGEKRCLDALDEFNAAKKEGGIFDVSRYVAPSIARCRILIDSGQSLDTIKSRVIRFLEGMDVSTRFAVGIAFIFGMSLCFVIWWLIREVRREEWEIHALEKRLLEEESRDHRTVSGKSSQERK